MKFDTQNCVAIITGASSGIGAEFARQLGPVARGLILVARRTEALEALRAELKAARPSLGVEVCTADLATAAGRGEFTAWLAASALAAEVNLLVNNAGLGDYGVVATAPVERLQAQIDLNITAVVRLTHSLLPLLARSPGRPAGILNISSLASVIPMPGLAVYAASKAFVTSFSEALAIELERDHVVVTCVCPGPTPTGFSKTARRPDGADVHREGQDLLRIPVSAVVSSALQALRRGHATVFPGAGVRAAAAIFHLLPRGLLRLLLRLRYSRALQAQAKE